MISYAGNGSLLHYSLGLGMLKTKILIVEDESIVARDIQNMLLTLGYEVAAVIPSASESIKKTKELKPDLVLMDVMLKGGINGVEAAHHIYTQYNIPIVYITAYADEALLQEAKKTEPFGYLMKPFEERELQTTIEIALYKFKMEMKLKEREHFLTTILQSIGNGVIATDKEGTITFLNPFAETLTGWKNGETLKRPLHEVYQVIDEETGKQVKLPFAKILQNKNFRLQSEVILLSKTGEKIYIHQKASRIKAETNDTSGVVFTFSDVTRRRQMEEELIKSLEKQKNAMEGTVQAMAFTLETRDPYTAGHQRRVTKIACAIAEEMDLTKKQIEGVRMAGSLHDIGKIYVPAEILSKPGKISEMEYNIIKTHPQVGYDILKSIDFPWPIAKIVLQHHERIDGSGYPAGIKGKEIHLEAKILAVADVIEAMATHRPYRAALTIQEALEEVLKNRNKLYASRVVDACIRVFREKNFTLD